MEQMPKPSEMMGMYQPGPMTLHRMLDGIWNLSAFVSMAQIVYRITNLEDNVAHVEDRKHSVVVVAGKVQVSLKSSKTSITNVGAIDETEEIQQRDCGYNHQINLQA